MSAFKMKIRSVGRSVWGALVMAIACLGTVAAAEPAGPAPGVPGERGDTYTQVTVSARYVRIQRGMPEAKGPLVYLGNPAGLLTKGILMTPKQAEEALEELRRVTNQDVLSSLAVTVAQGSPAKVSCTQTQADAVADVEGGVKVMVGGNVMEFTPRELGVSLKITPLVLADGEIEMATEIELTTFDGFVEYGGETVTVPAIPDADGKKKPDTVLKVPAGFYQPIFSTRSANRVLKLTPGTVMFFLVTPEIGPEAPGSDVHRPTGRPEQPFETWLVFLNAKASQAKRTKTL